MPRAALRSQDNRVTGAGKLRAAGLCLRVSGSGVQQDRKPRERTLLRLLCPLRDYIACTGQCLGQSLLQFLNGDDAPKQGLMLTIEEAASRLALEQLYQRLPVTGDVQKYDGLVVEAKLPPGEDLEEFFERAQPTGEDAESICHFRHAHLALMHRVDNLQFCQLRMANFMT